MRVEIPIMGGRVKTGSWMPSCQLAWINSFISWQGPCWRDGNGTEITTAVLFFSSLNDVAESDAINCKCEELQMNS